MTTDQIHSMLITKGFERKAKGTTSSNELRAK
jgi:hypothetical protein